MKIGTEEAQIREYEERGEVKQCPDGNVNLGTWVEEQISFRHVPLRVDGSPIKNYVSTRGR